MMEMFKVQNAIARLVAESIGWPQWAGTVAYVGFMGTPVVFLLTLMAVYG